MIIAVDIDEVLADTLTLFTKFYNNIYKTSFKREDFWTYDWWKILEIEREEFVKRFKNIAQQLFQNVKLLRGADAGVCVLYKKHKLIAVTGRPGNLSGITEKWIEKYFPRMFSRVYHTRDELMSLDEKTKYEICKKAGAGILIEDWFNYADDCAENGIKVLLLDSPWNHDVKILPGMARVHSWPEIVEEVDRINVN